MLAAAQRWLALASVLFAPFGTRADDAPAPARAAPSRPAATAAANVPATGGTSASPVAAIATRKIGGIDYVNAADVAARLGLKLTWLDRGRRIVLTGSGAKVELENDSRDATVNGLRVFLGDPVLDASGQLFVSRIDYERCLTPLLRPGLGVPARPAPRTIVLDPGHGGKDNGTSINEKTFALDVARRAKKALETAGYRVVLTRDSDTFVELPDRAAVANANRADLFVSVHFNAVPNDARTSGVEVYTFPPAHQHAANWWSSSKKSDPDLETTEQPVNRFDHWNVVLAQAIHRHFVTDLKSYDRGKKLMHLGVLRGLACPGVLIECGFLTSDVEARKIATTAHRQKIADAIAAGIRDYASTAEGPRAKSAAAASVRARHAGQSLD